MNATSFRYDWKEAPQFRALELKQTLKWVGLQPIQRDNTAYEFDLVFDIDMDHVLTASTYPPIDGLIGMKFQPGKTRDLMDIITQGMSVGTIKIRTIPVSAPTFAPAQLITPAAESVVDEAAAESARKADYTALCQEFVEGGYYPAKANVTAALLVIAHRCSSRRSRRRSAQTRIENENRDAGNHQVLAIDICPQTKAMARGC